MYFVKHKCGGLAHVEVFVLPRVYKGPPCVFNLLSSLICQFSHQSFPINSGTFGRADRTEDEEITIHKTQNI